MSQRIAYYRVSTTEQSIESQRTVLGGEFDVEYSDEGVSGTVLAKDRPGFGELLSYIRRGDTLSVYAVDRLGRDAIDIQETVRALLAKGVSLEIYGLGKIAQGVGEIIVAVLAQIASMERSKIAERTALGRTTAKRLLAETGKTQNGKISLGRPKSIDPAELKRWRVENNASLSKAAANFNVSLATAKRACRDTLG